MEGGDERQQALLRRKLTALNYDGAALSPGGSASCDLVQRLVDDLVHTTESYRALKQRADEHEQQLAACQVKVRGRRGARGAAPAPPAARPLFALSDGAMMRAQMEGIKEDMAKTVRENNQLHVQLIQAAEAVDAEQTAHYKKVKELEHELCELSFWKHQALARFDAYERENEGLKQRLADVLRLGALAARGPSSRLRAVVPGAAPRNDVRVRRELARFLPAPC